MKPLHVIMFTLISCVQSLAYTENSWTIEEVMEQTLCCNPNIQSSIASISGARGKVIQSSLLPNPELVVELENFGGSKEFTGFDAAEITVGIQQTIEAGGKRTHRTQAATHEASVVEERTVIQILGILSEVQLATVQYFVAKERLSLALKRVELAAETINVVEKRVEAAKASDIQRERTIIELKTAQLEMNKARKELKIAENRLESLVGCNISSQLRPIDLYTLPPLPDQTMLLCSIDAAPQKRMLEYERSRAKSTVKLAKARAIPNPTLGIGARRFNETNSNALIATLSIPIPLFDRNQGGIRQAQSDYRKVEYDIHTESLSLQKDAKKAWEQFNTAIQDLRSYQNDIIPSAEKTYALATEGYERGAFSFLQLLDAQRTLYEVQERRLDSLLDMYEAKSKTDLLLGTYECLVRNRVLSHL